MERKPDWLLGFPAQIYCNRRRENAGRSGKQNFDAGCQWNKVYRPAISKYMAHRKEKKLEKQRSRDAPVVPHGKQTVKQLVGQNQGISNIEITDPSIKEFEKIARKYGVDYAVKKDRSSSPPKYLIFFKGRDADALTAAFTEYTNKKVKKATKTERPSVLAKLNQFKEMVKNAVVDRTKRKELER